MRTPVTTKARLALEILWTWVRAKRLMRGNLQATLDELRHRTRQWRSEPLSVVESAWLARAVSRTLTPLPLDSRCLMQALVLSTMLTRRATPSTLVIGVRAAEAFGAHAWVEVGGRPIMPGADQFPRLVAL